MGDPKKPRKKYKTPRHPWKLDQLSQELQILGTYGLRNKRELWRAQTELSRIRRQARSLLAAPPAVRERQESILLESLRRRGIVGDIATLDDILSLKVEDLLERRLQTLVWRKGLAPTVHTARQMVVHGHIQVGDRIVRIPGYIVRKDEEGLIRIREDSPLLKAATPSA